MSDAAAAPRRRRMPRAVRFLLRQPTVLLGLVLTVGMLAIAAIGPEIAPHDPLRINNRNRLQPPNEVHRLGTDEFGRDVLSRLLHGARVSALVGAAVLATTTLLGTFFGLVGGYYRRLDGPIMRLMDALMTFPAIVLAVALIAVLGTTVANVVVALTIVFTPRTARVVRASVLGIRSMEYIEGARALGQRDAWVLLRHVLPNAVSPLIVQSTSLGALVGVTEFLKAGGLVIERSTVMQGINPSFEIYGFVLLVYFTICSGLTWLSRRLDRRLAGSARRTQVAVPDASRV